MSKANQFLEGEDAVSPVIGVILMVAITVILAAVIAAFVFGMGPPEQAPQASIRFTNVNNTASNITLQHQGGDAIDLSKVTLTVTQGNNLLKMSPVAKNSVMYSAGDILEIQTNATVAAMKNAASFTVGDNPAAKTAFSITSGEVTVTMIDTVSGQMIANVNYRA